jgi:glutamine cyclotransferase
MMGVFGACSEDTTSPRVINDPIISDEIPLYTYRVINEFPHDPWAFTQGLLFYGGFLYEGTGATTGFSTLRKVELETGEILQSKSLPPEYFGEGIAIHQDRIIQLTWRSHIALVHDLATFDQIGDFTYQTEGWGLTHDGQHLIMSDGTDTLYFRDPETFQIVRKIGVKDENQSWSFINELEYIEGRIFANIWYSDLIAVIEPDSGRVTNVIDLTGILPQKEKVPTPNVLNGIAFDPNEQRLFVTGKFWPKLFEIELIPADSPTFRQ